MAYSESKILVADKYMRLIEQTVDSSKVDVEPVVLTDPSDPTQIQQVTSSVPASNAPGAVVRQVGPVQLASTAVSMPDLANSTLMDATTTATTLVFTGAWFDCRDPSDVTKRIIAAQEALVVPINIDTATNGPLTISYEFEYSDDGTNAKVDEPRPATVFTSLKNFTLQNVGNYFRNICTVSRALVGGEKVALDCAEWYIRPPDFARLATQKIEEKNAAMGQVFAFLQTFTSLGVSTNVRGSAFGSAKVTIENAQATSSGSLFAEGIRDDIDFVAPRDGAEWWLTQASNNGGTKVFDPVEGQIVFATPAGVGKVAAFKTPQVIDYESGHMERAGITVEVAALPTAADAEIFWGVRVDTSRMGWLLTNQGLFAQRVKNGIEIERVPRLLFNRNPLTAANASSDFSKTINNQQTPVEYDATQNNIYELLFEWYGIAPPTFVMKSPDDNNITAHVMETPGTQKGTTIPSPFVALVVEIVNGSDGQALEVRTGSCRGGVHTSNLVSTVVVDGDIYQGALNNGNIRQFLAGPIAQRIDNPPLTGRYSISLANDETTNKARYGFRPDMTTAFASFPLKAGATIHKQWGENLPIYVLAEQVGSPTSQTDLLTGTTSAGTATNPANAKVGDSVYANITANGQTIRIGGYSLIGTLTSIQHVYLGCTGKKQSGTLQTAAIMDATAYTGAAGNVNAVATSSAVPGGSALCVAAWVSRESAVVVNTVVGMNLSWSKIKSQPSDDAHRTLDLWVGTGLAQTGVITANFASAATSSHIGVVRISGIDQSTPVLDFDFGNANNNAPTCPALTSINKGMCLFGIAHDGSTSTPAGGYTERCDIQSASGTIDGLTVDSKPLTSGGTETPTATLSAAKHWASIGAVFNPAAGVDPTMTLSYEYLGVAGPTTGVLTASSTVNGTFTEIEITSDRSWAFADFVNMVVIGTGLSVGDASFDVDKLYLDVVETSGVLTRLVLEELKK